MNPRDATAKGRYVKIAIDSNDLPAATRRDTWRGNLCDTYMGMDCDLPESFRSVIEGHVVGDHTLTRITSSRHSVDRSRTLIKRDGADLVFFGIALAGRAVTVQGGREAVLERGSVVVSDSSRPFRTHVEQSADIVWLSVPKTPMAERLRGLEDQVALSFRPTRPATRIALDLMAGFDEALTCGLLAHEAERLTTQLLDVLALTIMGGDLPMMRSPARSGRRRDGEPTQ